MQGAYSEIGFVQQILSLNLVPRENGTKCGNDTSLCGFSEMWYGVFLWAVASSLVFHLPAALLAVATLRWHKVARFMPVAILLMSILGPVCGGPHQCRDCRCVQSGREEDDFPGGLGLWGGAVLLCPGHLLLQGLSHTITLAQVVPSSASNCCGASTGKIAHCP